jgi:hypothetical protein
MTDTPDALPEDFSHCDETKSEGDDASAQERQWQVAQQRALLYLRALPLTAEKTLELALESLRRAKSEFGRAPGLTAPGAVMRALRVLMEEQGIALLEFDLTPGAEKKDRGKEVISMPALKRQSMVPEIIDRRPWFSFLSNGARNRRGGRGSG